MKKFIANNWILLLLGVANLLLAVKADELWVAIMNGFVSGMCTTAFVLGCIYAYCEEKYGK